LADTYWNKMACEWSSLSSHGRIYWSGEELIMVRLEQMAPMKEDTYLGSDMLALQDLTFILIGVSGNISHQGLQSAGDAFHVLRKSSP